MAGERTGAYSQFAIWKETTFNTKPASPTAYVIPVLAGKGTGGCTRSFAPRTVLRGDPNPAAPFRDFWKSQLSIGTSIKGSFLGHLLNRLFTSYAVTGPDVNGKYTHVWKIGTGNPRSFGCEIWNAATDIARGDWLHGLVMTALSGSIQKGAQEAQLTWDVTGSGKHDFDQSTRADASPDTFTDDDYSQNAITVKIDTVATVLGQQLDWKTELASEMQNLLDGKDYAGDYTVGGYKVSGKLMGLWDQASTLRALATGVGEHAVQIIYAAPAAYESLTLDFNEVALEVSDAQPWSDEGALKASLAWEGYHNDHASASAIVVTLVNAVTTYAGL